MKFGVFTSSSSSGFCCFTLTVAQTLSDFKGKSPEEGEEAKMKEKERERRLKYVVRERGKKPG